MADTRTLLVPSIVYNLQRALCAGVTLNLIFLIFTLADLVGGARGTSQFFSEFNRPIEAVGGILAVIVGFTIAPIVYIPVGMIAAWLRRQIGDVGLVPSGFFDIPFFTLKLMFAFTVGMLALACLIILMLGDPGVVLLQRFFPHLVPIDRAKLWNPFLFIRVEGDPEEYAAARAEARARRAEQRDPSQNNPPEYPPSNVSLEPLRPSPDQSSVVSSAAPDWIETTSGVANERTRHALEAANGYLDDATALVHPPTAIDAAKADEIDRLVVLAREQLADARAQNETAQEQGVADYIELLDAGAEQYAGMAHALGRRRLAEGARLIERAVERLERLGRRQGRNATPHLSLYLLSLVHLDLGDRGTALSFIRRAVAANPEDGEYRRLQDQIETELTASVGTQDRRRGGALGLALIAVIIVVIGGAGIYFWQSSHRTGDAAAPVVDPNHFDILPYTAQEVIVAREAALNIRTLPFARPDITVVRETTAGEVLNVVGLVNQSDGPWYQIRLADGRVGYFKASLAVPQSEFLNTNLSMFAGQWENSDSATRDLTRITIRYAESIAYVRVFGSCSPTDCDWGETSLSIDATQGGGSTVATASYDHGYSDVSLTLTIEAAGDAVGYQTYTRFKDGSGRQDYGSRGVMRRISSSQSNALASPLASSVQEGAPQTLEGQWQGVARQGSRRYRVVVEFSPPADERLSASIRYVDLNCSGTWQGEPGSARSAGPWRVTETINEGGFRCANGVADLALLPDGSLSLEWRLRPTGGVVVRGTLRHSSR